ncbi:tail tape measure protein [Novosphingobium sp. ZN18A2]|uniref:tail tape measure protein n=1 Tax=Novosphingobium sp. ZN18A2 TaxID=3079861 RepID=UPI0030CD97E2
MDELDTLVIGVRADTQGFTSDVQAMRGSFDSILVDGFSRAGNTLERGLTAAIRKGSLGFEDLRRVALGVLGDIASRAVSAGLGSLGLGSMTGAGGVAGGLGALAGSILGLPGRATGGPVTPGRGYVVGERGPELFVPTSAGRVEAGAPTAAARNVNVAIKVVAPAGSSTPESLKRSSRQVAQAVRRALAEY